MDEIIKNTRKEIKDIIDWAAPETIDWKIDLLLEDLEYNIACYALNAVYDSKIREEATNIGLKYGLKRG